jgi:hypothetical protein
LLQLLGLSAVFMAMTFGVFIVYGLLAHAFRKAVIESPRVQACLRRGFSAAFAGLGVQLAASERRRLSGNSFQVVDLIGCFQPPAGTTSMPSLLARR